MKKIIIVLLGIVVVAVVLYSMQGSDSPGEYAQEIRHERDKKELFMKESDESPMKGNPEGNKPLSYFDPDSRYRVRAAIEPIEDRQLRSLTTSDGIEKYYLEYGFAVFELNGVKCRLLLLEITEKGPYRGTLFLAFADDTSGKETYGAGRYLDLKKLPGMTSVILDFNLAYNPYCAYSDKFSCPFPPSENVLKTAVKAGEKTWH